VPLIEQKKKKKMGDFWVKWVSGYIGEKREIWVFGGRRWVGTVEKGRRWCLGGGGGGCRRWVAVGVENLDVREERTEGRGGAVRLGEKMGKGKGNVT
jgi:hypothetical protein